MKRLFVFSLVSIILACTLGPQNANTQAPEPPKIKLGDPMPMNLFVELAKAVNPAVVNISTMQKRQVIPRGPRGNPNDPFWEFFEQFMGPMPDQVERPQGLGTGFIIEPDGLIVTNNHVIDQADAIKVQVVGEEKPLDARVVGRDERTDIALIKINAGKKLPVAFLGDSSKLEVGEWVAAVGNPFGHSHSVSKGIISALGREINEINSVPFLQTDASINPGNSGGPLVNTRGEVIAVNAAIDARAQGIGFAIPINYVKSVLPELKTKGKVTRGYLGVAMAEYIHPRAAMELRLPDNRGALIINVEGGSPAAKAGLEPYDVIRKFGKREVNNPGDLRRAVLDQPLGDPAKVEIIRNGKSLSKTITLSEQASRAAARMTPPPGPASGQVMPFNLGFKVEDWSAALAKRFELDGKVKGPVVSHVEPGSSAATNGLQVGDILLDVNRTAVRSSADVAKNLKEGVNALKISRRGNIALLFL